MSTITVNIAFKRDLLAQIDKVAKEESRSRSEFLREAARAYIQKKERWDDIFALGSQVVERGELSLDNVAEEIASYRKTKGSE
ncbi:MAG: ribbon-helix-helix domain-containing protein [Kiritimatiellae bacterium]|jgi:CopG family transcriptional regulator/antitoxin EndoAI|nr:ribbon-helix-helix domain-containing protein [Kiritimatiellia bacterium]